MLIRGGDPKDTGLYVDGVRVPLVFHLMGFTSVFHPAMIERVDFYPGASDVRYGRATSGAVDLVSRGPEDAVREARLGADVLLASAWTGLRLGDDSTFSAAVRRSWLDAALAGVASLGLFGLEEGAEQVAPRFWDWQLRHDRPKIGILAFGTTDSLNARLSGEGEGDVVYEVGTQHLHLRYDARPAGLRLRVTPVLGTEWQRVVYNAFQDERRRYVGGGRVEILDPGATPVGWSAGVDVEAGRFEMAVTTEERSRLAREAGFFSADPYVDLRFGVDPTLVLGLRFEDLFVGDQLPRGMPSPRVQGRMPLTRVGDADLGAFAAAGVYHGWPLLDQVVGLPAGPYLALERSVSGELGLRASTPRLSVETSFFHRRLQNTTMTEDDGTLGQGEGRAWGIESLLRWTRDDWNGWISHTYGESLRREDPASAWEPSLYDQPHNLVVVMARDLGRGWVLSSRFRYASGYPVPEGTSEGSDLLTGRGVCLTDLSAEPGVDCPDPVRGERLPAFHALDVKVSREIIFRRWALDAYLDVQNLYNRRVPEPVITGAIDLANPYSVGLPILPLLGLQARTRW
jgi:outer membrane receptor protein involved in Fe transport